MNENKNEVIINVIQKRIKTFTRIEKAFYSALIVTAIILSVGIVYIQSRNFQLQQEISQLNKKINNQKDEFDNAKQEVNELTRYDRISEIAEEAGLTIQGGNSQKVE
ncbi:cell division protein FtsL [Streptococcus pacificus]|uniref:Cell division protein FtsL n=1 Tax=Streptococcus pacificus TaxID=2740577 RepID=A0ABS0ZGJ9_9STRE|nr:cell division protein FtsL [Streptococcus pacificus]MBJ8325140.1 cell division protein FtsL [Streptococcus pacificus]